MINLREEPSFILVNLRFNDNDIREYGGCFENHDLLLLIFEKEALEIIAVRAVSHGLGHFLQLFFGNIPHAKGDLLEDRRS